MLSISGWDFQSGHSVAMKYVSLHQALFKQSGFILGVHICDGLNVFKMEEDEVDTEYCFQVRVIKFLQYVILLF